MTTQEKLDKIVQMEQEIKRLEDEIKYGKQLELDSFLNEAVGNYTMFKFDENDDVFLVANERRGESLMGSGIIFYSSGSFETIEHDFFTVDIDSDFKILNEDEWLTIINNKTMSNIIELCK